nr:uncharacterized protein LOC129445960 [Misgurnus anguillicaudatus]
MTTFNAFFPNNPHQWPRFYPKGHSTYHSMYQCTTSTSTRSPVPLNLCVKPPPPSTSQCSITTTRPPVPLTPSVSVPVSATLQASEAIQRSSTSIQSDSQESHQETTHKITLLLLDLTKTYQHLNFRNKPAFYQKLRTAFTQKGYNLSTEKNDKKLSNMLTTYKRVKDRRRVTSEGKNAWEYYTLMDELFGLSGIGTAPPGTIYSTPLFSEETSSNKSTTLQDQQPPPVQDKPAEDEHPGTSAMQSTTNLPSRQRRQTQSSQFLESYEAHAERRTAVLETLVRPDLERWRRLKERRRRSFERKMLTSMGLWKS